MGTDPWTFFLTSYQTKRELRYPYLENKWPISKIYQRALKHPSTKKSQLGFFAWGGVWLLEYKASQVRLTQGKLALLKNLSRNFIKRAFFWTWMSVMPSPPCSFGLQAASQATKQFPFWFISPLLQRQCFLYESICFITWGGSFRLHI